MKHSPLLEPVLLADKSMLTIADKMRADLKSKVLKLNQQQTPEKKDGNKQLKTVDSIFDQLDSSRAAPESSRGAKSIHHG